MLLAAADAAQTIGDLLGISPDIAGKVLWGCLLAGLFCASIHLVTMLVTRWGDNDPSQKSLVFSILVHVSPEPGNTPVWEQLPETEQRPIERVPPTPPELTELATPKRVPEETDRIEPELKDVPQLPDRPEARPEPIELADRGKRQRADVPLKVDDPTAESRQEVSVPTTSRLRRPQGRAGLRSDVPLERTPTRGSVERQTPRPAAVSQPMGLETPRVASTNFPIKRAAEGDVIRRREGPVAGAADLSVAGANSPATTSGTAAGSPASNRFTRLKRRRPGGSRDGVPTRQAPGRVARTPSPRPGTTRSVRDGVASRLPVPGVRPNSVRPSVASAPRRR